MGSALPADGTRPARDAAVYLQIMEASTRASLVTREAAGVPVRLGPHDPWRALTWQARVRAPCRRAVVSVASSSSAPFDRPLEVTGTVQLVLWASSSAPDTDFTAKLVDVHPNGAARALTDGILRASYRRSRTTPALLTAGQPEEFVIAVGATSNVFLPGHRMRLEVSSSNFPRFDRNPNTGATFGTSAELVAARQTVFHDSARPSRLVLPVVPR
jgi:putative CocE/NonD family hydrolase